MLYDKIKRMCRDRGIPVSIVEKEAKLSNGSISKWNKSSPTLDSLQAVARVLGVKVENLIS